ncbi:hypothetical protein GCM10009636_12610 [Arthrobacter koreensis]
MWFPGSLPADYRLKGEVQLKPDWKAPMKRPENAGIVCGRCRLCASLQVKPQWMQAGA